MTWHWREEQWDAVTGLLEHGFRGGSDPWSDDKAANYRLVLDDYEPSLVIAALKKLIAGGQTFLPALGDIVGAIKSDTSVPSWSEAYELIFGRGGALRARPTQRRFADPRERDRAHDAAALARAQEAHPLLAAFLSVQGVERLKQMEIYDPAYGEVRLRDLRADWEEFVSRAEERRRNGLPLLTPALAQRQLSGPRPLNTDRLLTAAGAPDPTGAA